MAEVAERGPIRTGLHRATVADDGPPLSRRRAHARRHGGLADAPRAGQSQPVLTREVGWS